MLKTGEKTQTEETEELSLTEQEQIDATVLDDQHTLVLEQAICEEFKDFETGVMLTEKQKVTKTAKMARMRTKTANLMARQSGDKDYEQMQFHMKKLKELKGRIQKKYGKAAEKQMKQMKVPA